MAAVEDEPLFDAFPDAVLAYDPETGEILAVNEAGRELLGGAASTLPGTDVTDIAEEWPDPETGTEADGQPAGSGAFETRMETADGEDLPVAVTLGVTTRDGRAVAIASIRERTEHERRERELEKLTTRFELALEATDTGVWEQDLSTDEVVFDSASERLYGYEPGEFPGTVAAATEHVLDEDVPKIRRQIERALETDDVAETEFRVDLPDGDRRWILSRAVSEGDRVLGVHTDITERKRRERELRRRNEFLDEVAGVISHDVATPLDIIENKAQLVEMTGDPEHADDIFDAVERVREKVSELRELAQQGKRVDETGPVELADAVREAWRSVDAAGLTLTVEDSRTVEANHDRLRRLLESLLENAAVHGPDEGTVWVDASPDGFHVADDGPGIPPAERDRVFQQGYTTSPDRNGLGLAIARRIAEGHGWDIDVTDSDAGGARVDVWTGD